MATAPLGTFLREIHRLAGGAGRQWTDRQLLDDFAVHRDEKAFAALVARHGPMVLRVCRRVLGHEQDAEDAFQATFLVLAQNTRSIHKREALAGWLHGVAYRTAMKAKRSAARRRNHEARLRVVTPTSGAGPTWDEVQPVLDEEIERLPASYRAAFVLCVLEGKGGPEAAAELGCKVGTVGSRLTRARRLLQQRLARRGIQLATLLAGLSVAERAARAGVPAALAEAAVRYGLRVAAGKTAAGTVPSQVAALAAGVSRAMFTGKIQVIAAVLLAVGLIVTGGVLAHQALAARGQAVESQTVPARGPEPEPAPAKEAAKPPAADRKGDRVELSGRVLDPDGKPAPGARVYLLDASPPGRPPKARATSDADGGFRFAFDKSEVALNYGYVNPWRAVFVVAAAEGHGLAFHRLAGPEDVKDCTLRLARDDRPVEGRVLDLEGRPLAGVAIRLDSLGVPEGADLSAFVAALKANRSAYPPENDLLTTVYSSDLRHLFPKTTTDKKGRFTIKGVGRERVVGLTFSAPTIETRRVRVLTRPAETLTVPAWKDNPDGHLFTYHGSRFAHVAAPSSPIVGVVRDRDTGKSIPGAVVESYKFAGNNIHGLTDLRTIADGKGHYRLTGMPRGEGNILRASPPDGQPYVMALKDAPAGDGHKPVTMDFGLKRGVWITGKTIDKVTGKPVPGRVEYFAFADNPHLGDYPGFTTGQRRQEFTEDGTFRVVGLPGHGLLAFRAKGDGYLIGAGADKVRAKAQRGHYPTRPYYCMADGYHAFVDLDPEKGAGPVRCEVVLDPGKVVTGTLLGPDRKPLAGVLARGLRAYGDIGYWDHEPLPTAEFTARGVTPDRPRTLLFLHMGKKLAGSLTLKGDEEGKPTVRLRPWGTLTGRVVDEDGRPRAGAMLRLYGADRPRGDPQLDVGTHPQSAFLTGKDGTFRIEGLVPGMKYSLSLVKGRRAWRLAPEVEAGSGKTRDLGDVRPRSR
jgi:RNA polymerase sigma factor (sigma-70 family)